jgi:flagellin-specific chaperone FliS
LFLIYIDLGYLDIAERTILQAEDIAKYNKYDKVEKNTLSELKKLLNPNKSNEVKSYLQHVLTHHQKELTNIDKDIFTIYLKK